MNKPTLNWLPVGPALFAFAILTTPFFAVPLAFRAPELPIPDLLRQYCPWSYSDAHYWLVLTSPAWVILAAVTLRRSSRTSSLVTGSGMSIAIGVSVVSLFLNLLVGWLLSNIRT